MNKEETLEQVARECAEWLNKKIAIHTEHPVGYVDKYCPTCKLLLKTGVIHL